jgi:hypothetical protein
MLNEVPGRDWITVGSDKAYDTAYFVEPRPTILSDYRSSSHPESVLRCLKAPSRALRQSEKP